MEAAGLGIFMMSAAFFVALLQHPSSPVRQMIANDFLRRTLVGAAMGLTAICIIYSPWGKQSGAHINPSVTLTFLRLGKIQPVDALFYALAQFAGGVLGVVIAALVLGSVIAHPTVNYVATLPGMRGAGVAFIAEVIISFLMMTMILRVSNTPRLARFTGLFAGLLVMTYISLEDPFSGMSMNPARTFGSAVLAHAWTTLWLYFTAPPLGMLLAAEGFVRFKGAGSVLCAKLNHQNDKRCIFRCNYHAVRS